MIKKIIRDIEYNNFMINLRKVRMDIEADQLNLRMEFIGGLYMRPW
jgi:hypothetical protein